MIAQSPGAGGRVTDWSKLVEQAHERGALVAIGADLLACTLIAPPGEIGADVAFGTAQRFGVPMGFGGPHAGYLAVTPNMPASYRTVGRVSVDADGAPAYRLSPQTREQHIRRDKATSNICTAQVLLAVMAAMYASYHGADGLIAIAGRVHAHARSVAAGPPQPGLRWCTTPSLTPCWRMSRSGDADPGCGPRARHQRVAPGCRPRVGVVRRGHHRRARHAGSPGVRGRRPPAATPDPNSTGVQRDSYPPGVQLLPHRDVDDALPAPLADKDLALDRTMIPLGSCTMKLNAAAEMESITWPEFGRQHPFAPADDAAGQGRMIADLQEWLTGITGYDAISLQPNAGSQGEYAGCWRSGPTTPNAEKPTVTCA